MGLEPGGGHQCSSPPLAVRARLRELVQLLPQHFAQLDDPMKEAEIDRQIAANVGAWAKSEATR